MSLSPCCSWPHSWKGTAAGSLGIYPSGGWRETDEERQSPTLRVRDRAGGERYRESAEEQRVYTLTPNLAPAVPDSAFPTSSPAVPMTPARPTVSPHHSGWATVKRRCRRMLWFTRSFLKSPGELRGEHRGELGPGAGAGAGGPCIAKTAWRLEAGLRADCAGPFLDSHGGGARRGEGRRRTSPASPPLDRSGTPPLGQMGKLRQWASRDSLLPLFMGPRNHFPLSAYPLLLRLAHLITGLKSDIRKLEKEVPSATRESPWHRACGGAAQILHSCLQSPSIHFPDGETEA